MTAVWYIGLANVRAIYANQWAAAGHTGRPDTQWDASNGWSIPATSFTAGQLALLDADDEFNVAGADGPRPGSAVIAGPTFEATRSWVQEYLTAQVGDPESVISGQLSATYAPLREVYLSSYGVVANASDATVTANTATDCTTQVKNAFNACVDAFGVVTGRVVHDVPGWILITSPVDMKGVSLRGLDRFRHGFFMDPRTPKAGWKIGTAENDLAGLYGRGKNGWTVEGVGFDGADMYCQPLTVWGGDFVTIRNSYARRIAKNGFQLMGTRNPGDVPVRWCVMEGNIVEDTVWGLTIDGESRGCKIINNISLNAVVRHISVDPGESLGDESAFDTEIRGNLLSGRRQNIPASWSTFPAGTLFSEAILIRGNTGASGIVADNQIVDWNTGLFAIDIEWHGGLIQRNVLRNTKANVPDTIPAIFVRGNQQTFTTDVSGNVTIGYGYGGTTGTGAKFVKAHENSFMGATWGFRIGSSGHGTKEFGNMRGDGVPTDWQVIRTLTNPASAKNFAPSSQASRAFHIRVTGEGRISKLGVVVGTASGNIDVGVYDATITGVGQGSYPTALKASSGSVALTTTGYVEIPLSAPVDVAPGDWLAVSLDNITATLRGTETTNASDATMLGIAQYKNVSFPLPATISSIGTGNNNIPVIIGIA